MGDPMDMPRRSERGVSPWSTGVPSGRDDFLARTVKVGVYLAAFAGVTFLWWWSPLAVWAASAGLLVLLVPTAIMMLGSEAGRVFREDIAMARVRVGRCRHCGYDLVGLRAEAAACPECGRERGGQTGVAGLRQEF